MQFEITEKMGALSAAKAELGYLTEYFQMCCRYGTAFFEEYPGNTIYHLLVEDSTILFTFRRSKNRYFVSYLAYRTGLAADAWLRVLEDIGQLRQKNSGSRERMTVGDQYFLSNMESLRRDVNMSLRPFSFILTCLPDECFPTAPNVRLYNRDSVSGVSPEEIMVPLHEGDAGAKAYAEYERMRDSLLRPVRKGAGWELVRAGSGRRQSRRETVPAGREGRGSLRLSAVEEAFSLLWEK